jgi:alkylhydroperoxidase family enzyme
MELQIHTTESAPDRSKPILEGIAGDVGFVPNMAGAIAESPALLAAFDGLRRAVGDGELDPAHREVAGLATAVAGGNRYGVAFHSTVLGGLGVDDAEIERMRGGGAPVDGRCGVVYELARAIVLGRGAADDGLVARARALGFSDAEVREIVAECSFASLVGLVDNLAGGVELDPFLQARAWS